MGTTKLRQGSKTLVLGLTLLSINKIILVKQVIE